MLDAIIHTLKGRAEIQAWTVRQMKRRGEQFYAVPSAVEARRAVNDERYSIDVLRQTTAPDGSPVCGAGNATLLPGDDVNAAVDAALLMAGLVHNPPYGIPGPAAMPEVPLADRDLQDRPTGSLDTIQQTLREATAAQPAVRMTAAECFGEEWTLHLVNSNGIDATQVTTQIEIELVLHSKQGDHEVESFGAITRRRAADLDLPAEVARRARYTVDLLNAAEPPTYSGPVILRGATLSVFLNSGVLATLSAGGAKFMKITPWEIGQSVFRGEVQGDPLTVWATRLLPYGTNANRFDSDGLPARRIELIKDNRLVTFITNQRYADYLALPVTGAFGDIELPPGKTSAAELTARQYVEVVDFSWFNPDNITGEFASEIRLGYLVDGDRRTAFKGGMLVGNVLDALANVRWSAETGFYGDYQGPTTARFNQLRVMGKQV